MRNRQTRVRVDYRPRLETLEERLPPGDAVLGFLVGMMAWSGDIIPAEAKGKATVSLAFGDAVAEMNVVSSLIQQAAASECFMPRPVSILRLDSADGPRSVADDLPSFSAPDALARRRSLKAARALQLVMAFGARIGQVTAPPQLFSGSVGGLHGVPHAPVTALRPTEASNPARGHEKSSTGQSRPVENYGKLPLTFEVNEGQTDARVDFIAKAGGATVFLTPTVAVFSIAPSVNFEASSIGAAFANRDRSEGQTNGAAVYMQIVGGNPNATPVGQNKEAGIVNYFIGNDPRQWHTNIPTFAGVRYDDVYAGIDIAYYGKNGGQLEYDLIVSPGADPNLIKLNFAGADAVTVNPHGDLVLHSAAGDVVHQKPFTYQDVGPIRREVISRYVLDGSQVRFDVGNYDPARPLVIDPLVLEYSTYLGGGTSISGAADAANGIAVDAVGNAYVTGVTGSYRFPTTPGAFDTTFNGGYIDAFVSKLSPSGNSLVYSTYIGGGRLEYGLGLAVDDEGNAYATGITTSRNFPTTPGAFDTSRNGGEDAFVAKLNAAGNSLVYSTYVGGSSQDDGYGIAVDEAGKAYLCGMTYSTNFPTTLGALDTSINGANDAFVVELNASGSTLVYGTYLGGFAQDYGTEIAIDTAGNAYMTGVTDSTDFPTTAGAFDISLDGPRDAFVVKLSASGSSQVYGAFLGGSNDDDDFSDEGYGIAVDAAGNAYVTGTTGSADFPATPGAYDPSFNGGILDAFVTKVSATGSSLIYSTYLGGSGGENVVERAGIAVDVAGNAYLTGTTDSADFPTTPGAFHTTFGGGEDTFVAKLSAAGSNLIYGTFLGGFAHDYGSGVVVDAAGNAYLCGVTYSNDFPTTPDALKRRNHDFDADGFVTQFAEV